MVTARHWQQRRSGNQRPRVSFTTFWAITEDHQHHHHHHYRHPHHHYHPLSVSSGDSSDYYYNDCYAMSPDSITSLHSKEEGSVSGSSLQNKVVVLEDGCGMVMSNLSRLRNNLQDIPYSKQIVLFDKLGHPMKDECGIRENDCSMMKVCKIDQLRQSTRRRKAKVVYEEDSISQKCQKKIRQLRIMRYLGLAAPQGSPFSNTRIIKSAA